MKKSFWVTASVITFFIGIFGTAIFLLKPLPKDIQEVPLLLSCESESFPGISEKIKEIKKSESSYFSKNSWQGYKRDDWYGSFLKAMNQDSLLNITDDSEVYRFLWLRTFHHPLVVAIKRKDGLTTLSTVETNGAGGYEPREIIKSKTFQLKDDEYCNFIRLLNKSDFWEMTSNKGISGTDGAQWIMEGVKNGRYHITERWSPADGQFREACVYLLQLSGVDVDKLGDELY
jgi:hypothetical protein